MNPLDLIALLRQRYPDTAIHLAYHPDADPGDESGWCVEVEEVGRHFGTLEAAFRAALANPRGGPPTLIPSVPEDLHAIEAAILGQLYVPAGLSPRAASVVLPLVQRIVRERDQLSAEVKELAKAVESLKQEMARMHAETADMQTSHAEALDHLLNQRDALAKRILALEEERDTSPLAVPCPTCDAPPGERCHALPPRNIPDRDSNHDHVGRTLPEPHPARVAAAKREP